MGRRLAPSGITGFSLGRGEGFTWPDRDRAGGAALAVRLAARHIGWMITCLTGRGVLEVSGEDRVGFLQGLVSNDVDDAAPGRAVWAALLTPQGKYQADFFILSDGARLLLDCEAAAAAALARSLSRYRLRARAAVRDVSAEFAVHAAWDRLPELPGGAIAAPDPRLPTAGWRILSAVRLAEDATPAAWNAHRLALGLPDGSIDLEPGKTVLLEAGFDELHGVSWSKGCYMGQELTARTKYRGLVKRRILPVVVAAATLPPAGSAILAGAREAGTLHAGQDRRALATLRLDALDETLTCDGVALEVDRPDWLVLPG